MAFRRSAVRPRSAPPRKSSTCESSSSTKSEFVRVLTEPFSESAFDRSRFISDTARESRASNWYELNPASARITPNPCWQFRANIRVRVVGLLGNSSPHGIFVQERPASSFLQLEVYGSMYNRKIRRILMKI